MEKGELAFVRWLREVCRSDPARVRIGIGDDMAAVALDGQLVTVTADMLLDGVHFDTNRHKPEQIGKKAIGASLSDCAAMACRPRGAVVSVALPDTMSMEEAKGLFSGMLHMGEKFNCPIIGGDTTSWSHPLAIDVSMLGEPMSKYGPIRRHGARPGDALLVTGELGGSLLGKHMAFTPRLADAEFLVTEFTGFVHAMIDITDGVVLDAFRLCEASGCSAVLDAARLLSVASDRARVAAQQDGRSVLDHILYDGEDFELLVAVAPEALAGLLRRAPRVPRMIGAIMPAAPDGRTEIELKQPDGRVEPLEPRGYEHFR